IPKIKVLLSKLEVYERRFGADDEISAPIRNCLKEYLTANPNLNQVDDELEKRIQDITSTYEYNGQEGGSKVFTLQELQESINFDFEKFVKTRSSVRDFKQKPIEIEDVKKAVELARNAPSVCNRQ